MNALERAAFHNRPDLEADILKEIEEQAFYKHHDFTPITYPKVPGIVWWLLAGAVLTAWIIAGAQS